MARTDGRIEAGRPLNGSISARAWNRAQDAADLVLGAHTSASAEASYVATAPYQWVWGQHGMSYDQATIPRFSVVELININQTNPEDAYWRVPVIGVYKPYSSNSPSEVRFDGFGITIDPIAFNQCGRVAIDGCIQCKVLIEDTNHMCAYPTNTHEYLRSGAFGNFSLVAKPTRSGVIENCIVRLTPTNPIILSGTVSDLPWGKYVIKQILTQFGYVDVRNNLANITTIGTDKRCMFMRSEREWELVSVECS